KYSLAVYNGASRTTLVVTFAADLKIGISTNSLISRIYKARSPPGVGSAGYHTRTNRWRWSAGSLVNDSSRLSSTQRYSRMPRLYGPVGLLASSPGGFGLWTTGASGLRAPTPLN